MSGETTPSLALSDEDDFPPLRVLLGPRQPAGLREDGGDIPSLEGCLREEEG